MSHASRTDSSPARERRPRLSRERAARIASEGYGLSGALEPLPSERDQNFRLDTADGRRFVLKIARVGEERAVLELQHEALRVARAAAPELSLPEIRRALDGTAILTVDEDGRTHLVRLLSWLPGTPLARVRPHSDALLADLGHTLGTLDRALESLAHPALEREIKWDLTRALEVVEAERAHVADPERRALVDRYLARFRAELEPGLAGLRRSPVHQDANDHNVLVRESPAGQEVSGLIDFGDMVRGYTLAEPAVAAAYAMLEKAAPLRAAAEVLRGYHAAFPVPESELELFFDLIRLRLCASVTISARQAREEPENDYLAVSEAPAWELLRRLEALPPALAHAWFRAACGLEPCPRNAAVRSFLGEHRAAFAPLTPVDLRTAPFRVLDLSVGSLEPGDLALRPSADDSRASPDSCELGESTRAPRRAPRAALEVGRYGEPRLCYAGEHFAGEAAGCERRTVHLGVDLFLYAGSPVFAPICGTVHSARDNAAPLDYGPTLILRHATAEGLEFFTLYGHLSRGSLDSMQPGQHVERGQRVATLGTPAENGGWPPHLHFQVITDLLEHTGDFPGVAAPSERSIWHSFCPDPSPLLGLADGALAARVPAAAELLHARGRHAGPSLSVSYATPLVIVRGAGQHLYDQEGREYLDAVNNVPHVGHCHPRVVRAGQRQMALLNTNTRYLHELRQVYAERLTALFPDPLEVCFLVCSGSEANELALRLARAHTGAADAIVLRGGYHGNTSALVELSSYKFEGPGGFAPPPHVHPVEMPDPYRGPYRGDDPRAGARYAEHVARAIAEIQDAGRRPAFFLAEPLMGCGGQIVPPTGYLREAYRHVRAAGGVCIADEVQVGFGRVGTHMWAFETQGVVPDVVTLGKPIGNGHPMGAVVTTRAIADSFANGMEYFNTFGGNPVSCAIGLAVLDVIEDEGLRENARRTGELLLRELGRLARRFPLIGDVRGLGLYLGLELVLDRESRAPAPAHAAYAVERMKEKGVLTSTDGPLHNVVKLKPPLVFTAADAERTCRALEEVLADSCLALDGPPGARGAR